LNYVDPTVISNKEFAGHYPAVVSDKTVCATGPNGKNPCAVSTYNRNIDLYGRVIIYKDK